MVDGGRRPATGGERRGEVGIRVRVSELRGEGGGRTAAGAGGVRGNGRRWGSTGTGGAFIAPPAAGPPPGRPL